MERRMIATVAALAAVLAASQAAFAGKTVWIDELPLGGMDIGAGHFEPTHLVRLFPETGAGLRKGLTDIRMNGFYRLLETKRPVGRPGYVPPKGWPCADCPRGK